MGAMMQPVKEINRIEMLDVLRGFALLGILLLNIIGFGMHSSAYLNPGFDLINGASLDVFTWAVNELFAEGAMRALFSMLFGAGVVLFTTGSRGKTGSVHYRRTLLLLLFGIFDAYVLLWNGDILITYALAGAVLYWLRNVRAGWMFVWAGLLILLMSAQNGLMNFGLSQTYKASVIAEASEDPHTLPYQVRSSAEQWDSFASDFNPSAEKIAEEYAARKESYTTAFHWNVGKMKELLLFATPVFLFWDALAMMLLGMALYKSGILHGQRKPKFYASLLVGGFAVGLLVNGYEVNRAMATDFHLPTAFPTMRPTYHIGRLGMAIGYIGLIALLLRTEIWTRLRKALAATGRMALTNYLMHSALCLLLFTGAGLALVGNFSRTQLYPIVFVFWVIQLALSPWWLNRFYYGPCEWLWRALTYGSMPPMRRRQ